MTDGDKLLRILEGHAARNEWDMWVETLGPYSDLREEEKDLDEATLARNVVEVDVIPETDRKYIFFKNGFYRADWSNQIIDLGFPFLGIKKAVFCSTYKPGALCIAVRPYLGHTPGSIDKSTLAAVLREAEKYAHEVRRAEG